MESMPRPGDRVRFGQLLGTVVLLFPNRREVEVRTDSGLSLKVDFCRLEPAPEAGGPVEAPDASRQAPVGGE